jgi:hypothetical protein
LINPASEKRTKKVTNQFSHNSVRVKVIPGVDLLQEVQDIEDERSMDNNRILPVDLRDITDRISVS